MNESWPADAHIHANKQFGPGFLEKLGIAFDELRPGSVIATMPVEGNTQPYGFLHGGATCSLIETLASVGAAISAGEGRIVMGLQQTTNFLGTSTSGSVRGVATEVHSGRTTALWNVEVTHVESGKLLAAGRVTLAIREPRN